MIKESKLLNLAFRVLVFVTFALCTVCSSMLILYTIDAATKSKDKVRSSAGTFDFLDNLKTVFDLLGIIKYLFIACAVLSVLTRYRAMIVSVAVRTALLVTVAGLLAYSAPICDAYVKAFDLLAEAEADLDTMTDAKAERIFQEHGMGEDEAEKLIADLKDEGRLAAFASGVVLSSVVSFLLSLTSLHNLVKRDSALSRMEMAAHISSDDAYRLITEDPELKQHYYNSDEDDF